MVDDMPDAPMARSLDACLMAGVVCVACIVCVVCVARVVVAACVMWQAKACFGVAALPQPVYNQSGGMGLWGWQVCDVRQGRLLRAPVGHRGKTY